MSKCNPYKKRIIFFAIGCLFIVISVFLCEALRRCNVTDSIREYFVSSQLKKEGIIKEINRIKKYNTVLTGNTGVLNDEISIIQPIDISDEMIEYKRVMVEFATFINKNDSKARLYVDVIQGDECSTYEVEFQNINNNDILKFDFETTNLKSGEAYFKIYTKDSDNNNYLGLFTMDSGDYSNVQINGIEQDYSLIMSIYIPSDKNESEFIKLN